jgi:hypothetical protein
MADPPANPLVSFMDLVADAVDWIHDNFSDPALSKTLRSDLGLDPGKDLERPLPTGEKVRMRMPNGDPVDVDKDAFDATVSEVKDVVRLLFDFFSDLELSVAEIWDVVFLVLRVGAAQSLQARAPRTAAILRAAGLLAGLTSSEDLVGLDGVKALTWMAGQKAPAADDPAKPHPPQPLDLRDLATWRNWVGAGLAIAAVIAGDKLAIDVTASYGYEPDIHGAGSPTPKSDTEAQAAFSVAIFDKDPSGTPGIDASLTLTLIYLPPAAPAEHHRLMVALGGALHYTEGRLTTGVTSPEAGYLLTTPWVWSNFSADKTAKAFVAFGRKDDKALQWGESDGPHLLVDVAQLTVTISQASSIRAELKNVEASLALSDGDSFISSLSQELKSTFDIAVVFDKNGLRLEGGPKGFGAAPPSTPTTPPTARPAPAPIASRLAAAPLLDSSSGGLQASMPPKTTQYGPFRILDNKLELGRPVGATPRTSIELSTSVSTKLGPFTLSIDRIGMRAVLRAGGEQPNLGLLDLDFGFKPPNGIGVAIDTKTAKGAGFLYLDADKGEYAGVLELSVSGIALKAIGILNTTAPEPAGWSLLLLIFAEFRDAPWPLPLGFNLTAVGGIVGLQHEASVDQLRRALGTNIYDDLLFPADPVKDAARLIPRLRAVFPVKPGALTVGPTAEINWGQPPIVTARLAILAQFGGVFGGADVRFTRLTLLGTIRATAPQRAFDAPRLVNLTADVLGDYDVESGLLAIDARLRDSTLGGVEFSGSLIIRVGFGQKPAFAIAAGGFHPAFTDLPPALPARIDRLGLQWKIGDSVQLTLQAYAAITASSWQLGARFTIVAEIGPVDIDGCLGFDGIAYDDGRFAVTVAGGVRVKWRGHTLMSVTLHLVLDRNRDQVWHAAGRASFSVLWWDKTVHFEHTWGDPKRLEAARTIDAADAVRAALSDPSNWAAQLPLGGEALVTLAKRDPSDAALVLAHPLGTLTVTQRVAPLGLALDFIDGARVTPGTVVRITGARVGPATADAATPTRQAFSRARFQDMSESARLTQKSFEQLPAGVSITPPGQANPTGTVTEFDFESITLRPDGVAAPGHTGFPADHLLLHTGFGHAAASSLRQKARLRPGTGSPLRVTQPPVAVVDTRDLGAHLALDDIVASSATLARQALTTTKQLVVEAHEVLVP